MDKLKENNIDFFKLPSVFYNENNAEDRLFSSTLIKTFKAKDYLETMAGCGIRGLYLKDKLNVYVNDISKIAYENLKLNYNPSNCFNLPFSKIDINTDIIELDPFGSAKPFLNKLVQLNNKFVIITYTDIINLCKQKNKYNELTYNVKHPYIHCYNEYALRLVIYDVSKYYNAVNKKIKIITSYSYKHFLRVYLKIEVGKNKQKNVYYCTNCRILQYSELCINCNSKTSFLNNVWGHKINNLRKKVLIHKFLNLYKGSMCLIDMHEWYRKHKLSCFKDSFLVNLGLYRSYCDKFFYYCDKNSISKLNEKTRQYTS